MHALVTATVETKGATGPAPTPWWRRVLDWPWQDANDRRYAFARRGLAAVVALRLVFGSYAAMTDQPDNQIVAPGLFGWLQGFPPAWWLVTVQLVGIVAAIVALSGWGVTRSAADPSPSRALAFARTVAVRAAFPIAYLTYFYLSGIKTSGGKILHNDVLLLIVAFPLLFASENRRVRGTDGTTRPDGRRHNVGWTLQLAVLLLALSYFFAGLAKMIHSGPEWMFSDNVRYVMYWAFHTEGTPAGIEWMAAIPGNSDVLARLISITTIVFELGAPAILFWRRLRPWYALLAVTLHVGTLLTIGLDYWGWALTVAVLLVDWGQTEPRRHIPGSGAVSGTDEQRREALADVDVGPPAEGLLIFDGDCAFCGRCASWVDRRAGERAVVRPNDRLDVRALGLTPDQTTTEVWWVAIDGTAHAGYRAVALAAWSTGGLGILAGRFLLVPGIGLLAGPVYGWIARNRHRMPGGSDACRAEA